MKKQNNSNMPKALKTLGVSASLLLSACVSTSFPPDSQYNARTRWWENSAGDGTHFGEAQKPSIAPGSIVIAKRLPPVTELAELPLYGFLPFQPPAQQAKIVENWLEINLSDQTLTLRNGARSVAASLVHAGDLERLRGAASRAEVIAIETNPIWVAPNEYFIERGLEIPAEGDSRRFLKAALGEVAIFLDNGVVLHNGLPALPHGTISAESGAQTLPIQTKELGSILSELQIDSRAIGSRVIIR